MPTIQSFRFILNLILIGSCVYALCYYCHILESAQFINIAIVILAFLIAFSSLYKIKRFANSLSFILISICFGNMLISGLLQNSLFEIIPSITRYFLYIFTANLCYFLVKRHGLSSYKTIINPFLKKAILLTIFFVSLELVLTDVEYLNGAYRISGSFKRHQLGEAMFVYVILIFYWFFNSNTILKYIISVLLLAIIISTQSRTLFGIIFIVGILYYILRIKSIFKLIIGFILLSIFLFGLYCLVMYTDLFLRIKEVFTSDRGIYDASTLERIEIMEYSLAHLTGFHKYIGIGVGGFQQFYAAITGREAVAAHNNYLLFYIEGGYISLITYLLFQLSMLFSLLKNIRRINNPILSIVFFLFLGITVCSFLLNNYYFYCSETLLWSSIGAYLGYCSSHKLNKIPGTNLII